MRDYCLAGRSSGLSAVGGLPRYAKFRKLSGDSDRFRSPFGGF